MLLVEDDALLGEAVRAGLARAGMSVDAVAAAEPTDAVLRGTHYHLAILDIGLPGISGLVLLRRLRQRGQRVPVLMLTARDTVEDRVRGLNDGADDYLAKPFPMPELVARCQALIRRSRAAASALLEFGPLQLDTGRRLATLVGQPLDLTPREWAVLSQLMLTAPNVVDKARLADSLGAWDREITPNAIEIYASRLRGKLADSGVLLRTVRGLGYRLELAGTGLHQGLFRQYRHGGVVEDVAGLVEQAVLAVAGERVQCHVAQHAQLREAVFQRTHGARHQAVGVGGLAAVGRLQLGRDHREQRDHWHAQLHALLGQAHQPVDREALHAGHAGHVLHPVMAVVHEHRQDQIAGVQVVLAYQGAGEGVAAQAARPAGRKGGQWWQGHGVNAPVEIGC